MTIQVMANLSSKNNWELEQHLPYLVTLSFKMKVKKKKYIQINKNQTCGQQTKQSKNNAGKEEGKMAIQQSRNK